MDILAPAIAKLIEAEALLIQNNHWFGEIAPDDTTLDRYTLTRATVVVVGGRDARAADLTKGEAELVAAILDKLDKDLGGVDTWERVHAADSAFAVAQRLRMSATRVRIEARKEEKAPRHAALDIPAHRAARRSL